MNYIDKTIVVVFIPKEVYKMELFSGDIERVKREIIFLKNRYKNDKNIQLLTNIDDLVDFYEEITEEKYPNLYLDRLLMKKCDKAYNEKINHNINNFIKNKKFHQNISREMLSTMDDDLEDFYEEKEENTKISLKDMHDIVVAFLLTMGKENLLSEAIEQKRIFKMGNKEEPIGITIYNSILDSYYISVNKEFNDTVQMVTLIHELGHVFDLKNLMKKDINNYITSIYSEVISLMYEKKFLNFLVNNKINLGDVSSMVCDYYMQGYSFLSEIVVLSELDDKLLVNQKYQNLKENLLLKYLDGKESLEYFDISDVRYIDLNNSLCYGYGNMIATYFTHLEQEDKDLYEYKYNKFLNMHNKKFNIRDFREIIPDDELLFESMKSEMQKDVQIKKKILTN